MLKLAGSTAGSQVITVAAAPILTRLYGPESFGLMVTFASIMALLNEASSLRYELAIAVPEGDDDAVALVWLCFGLVVISTGLTALGVLILGDQLVIWLNEPSLKPMLWLLPVGVLLSGVYQPLSYWAIRHEQFDLMAQIKFRQSIFGLATNLVAAPLGTVGLLLGQIVGQSAGFVAILRQSAVLLLRPTVTLTVLGQTLNRYSHFGIYSFPAGLINTIGNQVPTLIFATAFGTSQLGQLALAQRLLLLPAGLIGSSVGAVFLSQAADRYRAGTLPALIGQASRKLLLYGLVASGVASLIFAPLVPIIFGQDWEPTQWIIPLLIPLFIGQLIVSPLSMAFIASEKNMLSLFAQAVFCAFKILPLLAFVSSSGFYQGVAIYAAGSFFAYISFFAVLWYSLK